ncbi:MAG TPA: hypothetical protein VKN99_07385 [Polyangia bacterium]|nr:hypothetical protein [Polyangia bacterium]
MMARVRSALSTLWRPERPAGPQALVDGLRALGAERVVLDSTLPTDLAAEVLTLRGVEVAALEQAGRARLCAPERAERAAAAEAATRVIEQAAQAGVPVCVLALGSIAASWEPADLARAFARDEWALGAGLGAQISTERAAQAQRHLDAARFALERVVAVAERAGVRVALGPRPHPWALPSLDEAAALLADFRGAPLGYWHDTAAVHCEQALGLGEPARWLERLGPAGLGVRAADACGLLAPLAPGLGEVDFTPLGKLPLATVTAPADAAPAEVAAALALVRSL